MTSDHPRVLITTAVMAIALGLAAGAGAETIAGTDLEAAELVADLPWAFEVAVEPATDDEGSVRTSRYRFQCTKPKTKTAPGYFLLAELTALKHERASSAESAFEELLAGAPSTDPETWLGYAWGHLVLSGALIYRLHAECTFSEESFRRIAERLEGAVRRRRGTDLRVADCRCGGGCREVPTTPPE